MSYPLTLRLNGDLSELVGKTIISVDRSDKGEWEPRVTIVFSDYSRAEFTTSLDNYEIPVLWLDLRF